MNILDIVAIAFVVTLVGGVVFVLMRRGGVSAVLIAFYPEGQTVVARKIADLAEGVMVFRHGNRIIFFYAQNPPVQLAPRLYAYLAVAGRLVANLHTAKQVTPQDAAQIALFKWIVKCEADEATCVKKLVDAFKTRTKTESGVLFDFDGVDIAVEVPVQTFVKYYTYKEELSAAITHEVISAMIRISENSRMLLKAVGAVAAASMRWIVPVMIVVIVLAVLFMALGPQLMQQLQHFRLPTP